MDDVDENDIAIMLGLTVIAAVLEAGDRAQPESAPGSPDVYTNRAAALFLASRSTLKEHKVFAPMFAALKVAGRRRS